jgi:hypothetical protein
MAFAFLPLVNISRRHKQSVCRVVGGWPTLNAFPFSVHSHGEVILLGLGVHFDGDDGDDRVGRGLWQTIETKTEFTLLETDRRAAREHLGGERLAFQAADAEGLSGPGVDVNVQSFAATGEGSNFGTLHLADIGVVNEFAMAVHPLADRGQDIDRWLRYRTIGVRANVEQIVAAVARALQQVAHYRFRRLPVVVAAVEAPAVVHGHAGFPGGGAGADLLLGRGEVFRDTGAIVDQNLGLQLPQDASAG